MPLVWRVLDRRPVGSLREYVDTGGGRAAAAAREVAPNDIVELLGSSGLRGRGGAGFPTGTKWRTVAASRSDRQPTTVVVNAAEGEPGTFKDRALLRTNPYRVVEGAIIAATTMQTDQIRIGIKASFDREIRRLTSAIAEMRDAGWLDDLDVQLVPGPSSYLFGEETGLLEVIEGRQPFPRVTPPYRRGLQDDDTRSAAGVDLAASSGEEGPPALVDNVETLANVALIVGLGADWFRELGTEASPGTIVCTVSGATRRSAVGEVAMGSTLREVIDLIGWGPRRGREARIVLAGTSNALIPSTLLDTPLTYEAMRDAGSGLGSAGFIVFDDTTSPAAIAAGVARFLSVESCGQCDHCKSDGLDIADVLRRSVHDPSTDVDVTTLRRRVDTVAIGARCNLAQQQAAVTGSLLELFPESLGSDREVSIPGAVDPVTIAPLEDLVGGRASLDTLQLTKQPDWSYGESDSGATPAARLGDTPVHVAEPLQPGTWPEWSPDVSQEDLLALVDEVHDVHDAIDALIVRAMEEEGEDLDDRIADVVVAVHTHLDVTRRVLFPMVRRVGDEEGDRLAEAADAQEQALLRLVGEIDRSDIQQHLRDLGDALHEHAAIGDELLALLQVKLDPAELSSLADGLMAARATSTVSRLYRRPSSVRGHPSFARLQHPATDVDIVDLQPAPPAPPESEAPPPDTVTSAIGETSAEVVTPPAVARSASSAPAAASGDERATLHRILVGVDGSPAAAAALEWAGRLADRLDAEIIVANVFEAEQAEVSPDEYARLVDDAERRLTEEWAAPLRGTSVRYRCMQLTGPPDSLLTATEEAGADLLVVGTRGAGRHARLYLGSLAHHLAHYTRRPLAIVPLAGAHRNVDRIVLGVDGSSGSSAAVRWCADHAAAGRVVIAVCAFDPHPRWGLGDDVQSWRTSAEQAISTEWTAPLRAAGVLTRIRTVEGKRPLAALESAAEEEDAGLFVVGTRGLSEVAGLRLGHLPVQLVHHTHLPVVLVPPADGA